MKGRFDYVRYDPQSAVLQLRAKNLCIELEQLIEVELLKDPEVAAAPPSARAAVQREATIALTKLEDTYARIGRAIRNRQVAIGGDDADLTERNDE